MWAILSHLDRADLTNAANVCVRFNKQAVSVFKTKFSHKLEFTGDCTFKAAKNSLQTFGSLVQTIDIQEQLVPELEENVLHTIVEYCATSLEQIFLDGYNFAKSLNIHSLSVCKGLREFKVMNCYGKIDLFSTSFENLTTFSVIGSTDMLKFFSNYNSPTNGNVKKIVLEQSRGIPLGLRTWRVIYNINQFKNLTELEYNVRGGNVFEDDDDAEADGFQNLTSLKVLKYNLSTKLA